MKPDKPQGPRGALLIRVSDAKQDITRQREQLTRYAEDNGLNCVETSIDEGSSRHNSESRSAFQRMKRHVEAGKLNWILIASQDRLGFKNAFEYGSIVH